jgi:hypothetical protein
LDKIYYDNMIKFLNGRNYTVTLSDVINESRFKYQESNGSRGDLEIIEEGEDYIRSLSYFVETVSEQKR